MLNLIDLNLKCDSDIFEKYYFSENATYVLESHTIPYQLLIHQLLENRSRI